MSNNKKIAVMNEISKVCRACLTVCENTTYELFENVSADLFYYCTSIKVN